MRLHAEEPTSWPSPQGWRAWWLHQIGEVDRSTVDAEGFVEGLELSELDRVQLTAGQHRQPGALYQVRMPRVTVGAAAAAIEGVPGRRTLRGKYQDFQTDRSADLELDGFDDFVAVRSTSTLQHLSWTMGFAADRGHLLDIDLALDWLRITLQASVVGTYGSERLVVDAEVRGAGLWRPVVSPLLVAASRWIETEFADSVRLAAKRLRTIDSDPAGQFILDKDDQLAQQGAQVMRDRAEQVQTALAGRSWWRRRSLTARAAALAALPPAVWPETVAHIGDWSTAEQRLHRQWFSQHRSTPAPAWISEQVIAELRSGQQMTRELMAENPSPPPPAYEDAVLRLDWLRSPWSTVRFLGNFATEDEAQTAVRDMLRDKQ